MCLGIPMQVKEIDGFMARCEAKGVMREVSLLQQISLHSGQRSNLQHNPDDRA